jgi:uncharacterized protein
MSPRQKRLRRVITPPVIKGYKPYGPDVSQKKQEPVVLLFEEYEALRLCDYDMLNHAQASEAMQVSRPTFTRVYAAARQKVARAFVEGCPISIEGGKVYFDSEWFHCSHCDCHFNNPEAETKVQECPLCGSDKVMNYEPEQHQSQQEACTHRGARDRCSNRMRQHKRGKLE